MIWICPDYIVRYKIMIKNRQYFKYENIYKGPYTIIQTQENGRIMSIMGKQWTEFIFYT